MIAWLDGIQGVEAPPWVSVLTLAQLWRLPPWEVEKAPLEWVIRTVEFYNLKSALRK